MQNTGTFELVIRLQHGEVFTRLNWIEIQPQEPKPPPSIPPLPHKPLAMNLSSLASLGACMVLRRGGKVDREITSVPQVPCVTADM